MTHKGLAIRFDGPPGPEAGRFIEAEIDGKSVRIGEWKQDGGDWLLLLGPVHDTAPLVEALRRVATSVQRNCDGEHDCACDCVGDAVRAALAPYKEAKP